MQGRPLTDMLFEYAVMISVHAATIAAVAFFMVKVRGRDYRTTLGIIGVIEVLLFSICVAVPYFFQGYAEWRIEEDGLIELGWTRNFVIGLFAYLLSYKSTGFAWLVSGIACVALGQFSRRLAIDATLKAMLIILACAMLTHLDAYARMNLALE